MQPAFAADSSTNVFNDDIRRLGIHTCRGTWYGYAAQRFTQTYRGYPYWAQPLWVREEAKRQGG